MTDLQAGDSALQTREGGVASQGGASRLLILDDDPVIGATLVAMASEGGVQCRATSTYPEFYAELQEWNPTHIALDLIMPQVDGIEVLQRLADMGCESHIVITSGADGRVLDAAQRSAEARGLSIAGVIGKPFSIRRLWSVLARRPNPAPQMAGGKAGGIELISPRELTDALASDDQIWLAFQPKVSCKEGSLHGFEALVRWEHPRFGNVAPDRFLPVAEQAALMPRLTEKVIGLGLDWLSGLGENSSCTLALNVSASVLDAPDWVGWLSSECDRRYIDPIRIVLEVTETSVLDDGFLSLDLLTRLRLRGFELSIDDFGVGYSSLVQLARMPFSELKIDRSFVSSASTSEEARNIIQAIVGLARSLGLRTVAEGVEELDVFEFLKETGCDVAQGYLIGRPMRGDDALHWMQF